MTEQPIQGVVFDFWGVLIGGRSGWSPDPLMLTLLDALRARSLRLALLSNGGGSAARLCQRFPELERFDAIFLSGEVGVAKPSRQAFLNVEQRLALPPPALLFVDDSRGNVAAARQYGWQSHLFEDPWTLQSELIAWGLIDE